jgi:hypothetical protein
VIARGYGRSAAAGVAAAWVWAAVEPLDTRLAGWDYRDVALLGKALTRGRAWPLVGLALHGANGAVFGVALEAARRSTGKDARRLAVGLALAEHLTLFPLGALVDRIHPARGEPGVAPMFTLRGFALETWRHALFGAVLGRLV